MNEVEVDISEEELEEEKPSKLRRIFIIISSLFLLFLIITFVLTNSVTRDIFAGLIESSSLKGQEVDIDAENKLVFDEDSYNKLMELYDNNLEKEFKVCLKGSIKNGDYYINEIFIPETFLQTYDEVVSEPCPADTLVLMHSHPLRHCLPSEQDLKNFNIFKMNNSNALMAIMCEKGRFNFYS